MFAEESTEIRNMQGDGKERSQVVNLSRTCPYLGTLSDAATSFSYPSQGNHCYRSGQASPIQLSHQNDYCTNAAHKICPIYLSRDQEVLAVGSQPAGESMRRWLRRLLLVLAGLLLLLASGWWLRSQELAGSWLRPAIAYGYGQWEEVLPDILRPDMAAVPTAAASAAPELEADQTPANMIVLEELPISADSNDGEPVAAVASPRPEPAANPVVSYGDSPTPLPPTRAGTPTEAIVALELEPEECQPPQDWVAYTVQARDTLESLAAARSIPVARIQRANCLTGDFILGKQLFLPAAEAPIAPAAGLPAADPVTYSESDVIPSGPPPGPVVGNETPPPATASPAPPATIGPAPAPTTPPDSGPVADQPPSPPKGLTP